MPTTIKVPFIDLQSLHAPLQSQLKQALSEVIDSCSYTLGPRLERLESQLAERCQTGYALGIASGSDALYLSLLALGIGPEDLVLTSAYSFVATGTAITRTGAEPVFLDIDPGSYNLSANALEAWLDAHPELIRRVKAILPVHLFGRCADMQELSKVAQNYHIPLIEDAAQALSASATIDGQHKPAGSMGALGCFSFYPTKNLGALGDGGLITTQSEELYQRVKALRSHGCLEIAGRLQQGSNYRLDELQAAALLVKINYLDSWDQRRRELARNYLEQLRGYVSGLPRYASQDTFHQFVIRVPTALRSTLISALQKEGCETRIYYGQTLREHASLAASRSGPLPEAEKATQEVLALPINPALSFEQQNYLIEVLKKNLG